MLTYKQWCGAKHKITQYQRAQIPDIAVARKFVLQAIEEALTVRHDRTGLVEEDLDCIFKNQPMHFDGLGYVPHYFERQDIKWWGVQMCRRQRQQAKTNRL
jgi:hypothetical protein